MSERLEWAAPFLIKARDGRCQAWSGPEGLQGVRISPSTGKATKCEVVGRVSTAHALLPAAELRFLVDYEAAIESETV